MNGGISFSHVAKQYGGSPALDDVSFTAHRGQVTGLVGPNGAGKTTAMRILLGLARPDQGQATVDGVTPRSLPPGVLGASLGPAAHPGRSGRSHMQIAAAGSGFDDGAVEETLRLVGLEGVAGRRIKGYSLGMRQRLSLAGALLGHPQILVLDEPANGLDPDGIEWLRHCLRTVAGAGGAVLVSSHLLLELAQMADAVVMLDRRVLWSGTVAEADRAGGLQQVYQSVRDRMVLR